MALDWCQNCLSVQYLGNGLIDLLHIPDHIEPTLIGHFQFKVQNYGIVYQRILETAHQSIGLKRFLLYNN